MTKDPRVRREELLDIALALSNDVGFEGMSVELVTQTAGVAKGTFYHYFKSKNDLLYALAERFGEGLFAVMREAVETQPTPTDRLGALMRAAAAYKTASSQTAHIVLSLMNEENQVLRRRLMQAWEATTRVFLRPVVADGASDGSFHVLDVDSSTDFLIGLWFDFADRLWIRAAGATDPDEFMSTLLNGARAVSQAQERILGLPDGTFTIPLGQPAQKGLADFYQLILRKP